MMKNEDFVTLEQAKALKTVGFRDFCFFAYDTGSPARVYSMTPQLYIFQSAKLFLAPTLAQAAKW